MTKTTRRERLPDDFTVPEEWRGWCREKRWTEASISREAEKFVDYHLMHGSLMASWSAAWRTWCRKAEDFGNVSHVREGEDNVHWLDEQYRKAFGVERRSRNRD